MKKLVSLCVILFSLGSFSVYAQLGGAINDLSKQTGTATKNVQSSATSSALSNLDKQLKSQFGLDGAKSQIMGDALKIKVADSDFTKLSAPNKSKQGNQMMDAATGILSGSGLNLKSLGITNIILEMVKSMSVNDVLDTFKKKL